MFTLWVQLQVKSECRDEFLKAIHVNAEATVRDEPGCYRFDVIEVGGVGSNRFAFYEIYRDEDAFELQHKQAPHYREYKEISARVVVPGSQVNTAGVLLHSEAD